MSRPGYTVIAIGADGKARSVRVRRHRFRLRAPAARVVLQLRARDGTFAGPIVLGRAGNRRSRAVLGVKAGAKLGPVAVKARAGYAKVTRRLARRWVDRTRWARARRRIPIGTGRNSGRVRSAVPSRRARPPGDRDADGVPDPLDVDDDGDLILDNFERSKGARPAQAGGDVAAEGGLLSVLSLRIEQTVNANAGAESVQDVDATLSAFGVLKVAILPGDSAELDCGAPVPAGLPYCAPGGTGAAAFTGAPGASPPPFPACCDADGDGFGTLSGTAGNFQQDFFLAHRATTDQIGTGDVLIERVTSGGQETQFPATLQMVLATVPALVSYDDGEGNAASVAYPVGAPGTDCTLPGCPGGPGTFNNPLPVTDGADGDLGVSLTFWRPQRRPIPPETAEWIDIGGLLYEAAIGYTPELPAPYDNAIKLCPQVAYSDGDQGLAPETFPLGGVGGAAVGALRDQAPDRAADPANRLTYSVDISRCIAEVNAQLHSAGVSESMSWDPGDTQELKFIATNGYDNAQQTVFFKRP